MISWKNEHRNRCELIDHFYSSFDYHFVYIMMFKRVTCEQNEVDISGFRYIYGGASAFEPYIAQ